MALGIDGVRIGTWTSPDAVTGCTVVLPPDGTLGAVAVRGAAPGTREAAALGPAGHVEVCHAVVLSGSSAYGLSVADGVMSYLEVQGRGYPVGPGVVPIVGAAIVLDAGVFFPDQRPGPEQGRTASEQATEQDPPEGAVGVGTGCTVAKVGGLDRAWRGGQGIAVRTAGGITVGAIVANNAVGEVIAEDGTWIARSRIDPETPRYPEVDIAAPETRDAPAGPSGNTVIGCIVTDATLTKAEAHRVADLGHSGIARALRPAHTQVDGDALFCLATGQVPRADRRRGDDRPASDGPPDDSSGPSGDARPGSVVDLVAQLAAEAVAEAARGGPLAAVGSQGLPGLADTH